MTITKTKIFVGALVAAFALAAGSASAAYMHTVTLKQGSSGSQVMALQQTLNMTSCKVALSGAGAPGMESTTFGPKTKAAVQCFQAQNGLTADGVVGPMTGAKLGMVVSGPAGNPNQPGCPAGALYNSITGAPCTGNGNNNNNNGGSLSGTDGSIDDVNKLSQYNNEEVGEGQNDVKVLGFEVQASNDGDVALRSLRLTFDTSGNTGSDHLDDYIDGVTVWMGSTEVGSANVDDFNEDSNEYSKSITLNNAIVRADKTEKFYVSIDAVNNLDSGDITGDDINVNLDSIRFEDGSGVVTTEDSAGDLNGQNVNADINFVSFSAAADTELKISTDSNSPDAGIVVVDDSDNTDDVVLLKGKLKLDGDSDVNIDEFPVTFTVGGATNIDAVANSVTLVLDGEEYTESLGTNCSPSCAGANASATVTFDNLDFDLSAGDTISFEVRADINDIETGTFDAGDTLLASVTSTNRNEIDVENEEGDQLADSGEKSGTAIGEAQEFRSNGVSLTLVSTDAKSSNDTGANNDTGTFTIKFKVSAIGDDVYVATTASTAGSVANTFAVDYSGTTTVTDVSGVIINSTDTDLTSGGNWLIEEGQSETLTLTVIRTPSTQADLYRAALTALRWNTTDSSTSYNSYTSNLETFKTDYVSLN